MPTAMRTSAMRTSRSVNPARFLRMTDNLCVGRAAPSPFRCGTVRDHAWLEPAHRVRRPAHDPGYLHAGSPSAALGTVGFGVLNAILHFSPGSCVCVAVADQ